MSTTPDLQSQLAAFLKASPAIKPPSAKPKPRIFLDGLTNGLTGQNMFLEEHEYPAYMNLGAQFIAELRPVGVRETQIAQKIIDLNWRLNTMSAVENNLFHSSRVKHVAPDDPNDDKTVAMISKATTWRKDCEGPNAFEKLGRHETRVERSLFRMTAEFERLQAIRLKKGDDAFIQAECKAWIWYDHMLALHTKRAATPSASTASAPKLLCKKPDRVPDKQPAPDPLTFAAAAAPFVEYASANGLLTPEQEKMFERLKAA